MTNLLKINPRTAPNININIFLSNLDQITEKTLTYYFGSSLCDNISLANSHTTADLYIIDCQREFDPNLLNNINNSRVFAVLLYIDDCDFEDSENIALLKKPINIAVLETKISHVRTQLFNKTQKNMSTLPERVSKCKSVDKVENLPLFRAVTDKKEQTFHIAHTGQEYVGANTDIKKSDLLPNKIFITVDNYLFHYLQKCRCMAKTMQSNMLIKHFLGNIFYNYKEETFSHSFTDNQLKYIQSLSIKHSVEIVPTSTEIENTICENDINFIWKSAIQASKGRIPKNVDINSIVKIKSWPNFSQLQVFEYAIRIVAVWSKYKLSLYDTAKLLQIPQRYVFTLYCAMSSLEQIGIDKKSIQSSHIKAKSNKTSLFTKILSHMFVRKANNNNPQIPV